MGWLAYSMLLHNRSRFALTVAGIAVAFFLSCAQVGLLVGWVNTTTAIIRHTPADVWVMAEQASAFDYGTAMPSGCIQQARCVSGVGWAQGMFMAWNIWQRPDGRRVNIELIGLDEDLAGGPWKMREGMVNVIHQPDTVIVDALYMRALGVEKMGDEVELIGNRAIVGGISSGIRTFTASPFIFTSLEGAIRYDKRYRDDEVTYVLVRCAPGFTPQQVKASLLTNLTHVDVLTSGEFLWKTVRYWMVETGLGMTVIVTAVLGLGVGVMIISQNLYAVTQDHLNSYATLLALGFSRRQMCAVVLSQSFLLGVCGIGVGTVLFALAAHASADTPIPLETTVVVFSGLVGISLLSCLLASFVSIRTIFRLDPVVVFTA